MAASSVPLGGMSTNRNRRRRQVAVIGGNGIEKGSEAWTLAEEVGRGLAEAGVTMVCGWGRWPPSDQTASDFLPARVEI